MTLANQRQSQTDKCMITSSTAKMLRPLQVPGGECEYIFCMPRSSTLSYNGASADKAEQDRPLPTRGGCFSGFNRSEHLPSPGHHSIHSSALPKPGASLCYSGGFTPHSRHVSDSPTYSLAAGRNPLRPI